MARQAFQLSLSLVMEATNENYQMVHMPLLKSFWDSGGSLYSSSAEAYKEMFNVDLPTAIIRMTCLVSQVLTFNKMLYRVFVEFSHPDDLKGYLIRAMCAGNSDDPMIRLSGIGPYTAHCSLFASVGEVLIPPWVAKKDNAYPTVLLVPESERDVRVYDNHLPIQTICYLRDPWRTSGPSWMEHIDVELGVPQLFIALLWYARDHVTHPANLLYDLLIGNSDPYGILSSLHRRIPYSGRGKDYIFYTMLVVAKFFIPVMQANSSETILSYIDKSMKLTTSGLQMLLCGNNDAYNMHDVIRRHECFWVSHVPQWLDYEKTVRLDITRIPAYDEWRFRLCLNINDSITTTYEHPIGTVFHLMLYKMNVYRLFKKLVRVGTGEPFFDDSLALVPGVFSVRLNGYVNGYELPNYSDPKYGVTSAQFIEDVQSYCLSLYQSVMNNRFTIIGDLIVPST